MTTFPYKRIAVVGTTGSGKSTLAEKIAHLLHIPHIELDALYWQPNWKESSWDVMRSRVQAFTHGPAWVTDGNYGFCRDIIWSRVQVVVWLDYSRSLILLRLWLRTWRRAIRREYLWGTNYEHLWNQFFSHESIFRWALQTFNRRREIYASLFASNEYSHLKLYHFNSPRETEAWLQSLL